MPARLTRVRLRDDRSLANCDAKLQPLRLLVGPNGSGKSNFIDSLRFLHDSMQMPLGPALRDHSGILRKLDEGQRVSSFSIVLDFVLEDGSYGLYSLVVNAGSDGTAKISTEECYTRDHYFGVVNGNTSSNTSSIPALTGDRPALVAFGSFPAFAPVFHLIAGMAFCSPNPDAMRLPTPVGSGGVLERLELDPTTVRRLRCYLHSFNPEFADVSRY